MSAVTPDPVREALVIAVQGLRWCYREKGIMTGSRGVYWSWDSYFASFGSCILRDYAEVRRNLHLYFSLQREDGLLPKRVAHPYYWIKYLGIPLREDPLKQRGTFSNSYFTDICLTSNATVLLAVHQYVTSSGDTAYFDDITPNIERAFAFLKSREGRFGLLHEGIGGGWAESVLKRGAIAFTNMCYARSAQCLSELYAAAGTTGRSTYYAAEHKRLKSAINTNLWSDKDGGFYSDWLAHWRYHHFATDGNLLAVLWDIASPLQAQAIQAKIAQLSLEDDVPIRTVYGRHAFWRIYPFLHLGGMSQYHVGFCWTWLGCIDVMVKARLGQREEALLTLRKIAAVIARDGTVHEIYDKNKAVHTPLYKSEHPWGWGAGLFIAACASLDILP